METPFIKKEINESNIGTVTIKLEPEEEVDAKLYISNCQTCETPIEPRLLPIKKEFVSPINVKLEKKPNFEELIHPAVRNEVGNSPEAKENKSSNSSPFLAPPVQQFKRSRSLSSSSSNFSHKPRKLFNVNFRGNRPFVNHYRTNNPYYPHQYRRVNFNRRRPHWKKFRRSQQQFNMNYMTHNCASPGIDNGTMKIEIKPEMELRVVRMTSNNWISGNRFLDNNRKKFPSSQTHLDHQLHLSNTSYSENINNMDIAKEKMSLNSSSFDKNENSVSNVERYDSHQLLSSNTLSQKSNYEENVPVDISMLDNENPAERNNTEDIQETRNKDLTVCIDGKEVSYFVLDEVNEIEMNDILIDNVSEEERTFSLDVEVVKEIPCDNDIVCVFSKLKEAHLCTKCFVEKRRKKKNDAEVMIVKKIDNHKDIPLIDIEQ
ncbi:UNVERIFIED_CONTAM: hypothetical protein RMT77_001060 [Armadillidium vulgare]